MPDVEIGAGKSSRRGYSLDDLAIVPSRRTRDPKDVDLSFAIDGFSFALPLVSAASDAVVSPSSAVEIGRLGGLAVLNLEGLWTRYEDPGPVYDEIATLGDTAATRRLQELYAVPIREELITERIRLIAAAGVTTCGSLSPQSTTRFAKAVVDAELDILVIKGSVVSAEHVSRQSEPLNLKRFIREYEIPVIVGGCTSYSAALHLMRTGAVGVLAGVGTGSADTTSAVLGLGAPHATAIADAAGARSRHLEETGVYVHVIADGGMASGGDIAKAIACGADAVMLGAPLAAAEEVPGGRRYWEMAAAHPELPRGALVDVASRGTLAEVISGPARASDGSLNLFGALRAAMAMCGCASIMEMHKTEVIVTK